MCTTSGTNRCGSTSSFSHGRSGLLSGARAHSEPDKAPTTAESKRAVDVSADGQRDTLTFRLCGAWLRETFVDLGMSRVCESYVEASRLDQMEPFYPLRTRLSVKHVADAARHVATSVRFVRAFEQTAGATELDFYRGFGDRVATITYALLRFLIDAPARG